VFAQPELTMASIAHRPTTSLPAAGSDELASPAVRRQRLPVRRAGDVERTVITSDGVRLAVRDYGAAGAREHTVVLLHGLCLTQSSWAPQVRHLVRRWGDRIRIITYDHRGHGRSTGADMHTYRVDRLAADLAEVLTVLHVTGPLTLAGHSMGGMTALAYLGRPAADRPLEPQGLVLVATAAGRLAERGLGRLLATRATGMLFDLVHRMPRRATDQAFSGLVRPVWQGLKYFGAARSGAAAVTAIVTEETPGRDFRTASHSRLRTSAAAGASVVRARRKETFPPPTARSLTKPKDTMSREKPGYLTFRSVSRTACSLSVAVDNSRSLSGREDLTKAAQGRPADHVMGITKKSARRP